MDIGIIGGGRVGTSLAIAVKECGLTVSGVYSRNDASVDFINSRLKTSFENCLVDTIKKSEVLFLAVQDDEIQKLAGFIASTIGQKDISGKVFMHLSGSLTSDVMENIRGKGACVGSLHPIQTFADKENGWKGFKGIYFGFEGSGEAQKVAEAIVDRLEGYLMPIGKQDKAMYHAALCILSNYMVTLSYITEGLFEDIGIDPAIAMAAVAPLIQKTSQNIINAGSIRSLTGPIARGDTKVIGRHMQAFEDKCPQIMEVYRALGKLTVGLALKKGSIGKEEAEGILCCLDQ